MKINSPWPHHSLTRCTCKTPRGEVVSVQAERHDLEIEDDAVEALVEPVKIVGRGGNMKVLSQGRVWSREWGLLDIEDHVKKMNIKEEEAELQERLAKEKKRRKEEKEAQRAKVAKKVIDTSASSKLDMGEELER